MKTNHIQMGRDAYCLLVDNIVNPHGPHVDKVCVGAECPYLVGSAQGDGVECYWDSHSDVPMVENPDPFVLQTLGRLAIVSKTELGPNHPNSPKYAKRKAEVIRRLKEKYGAFGAD